MKKQQAIAKILVILSRATVPHSTERIYGKMYGVVPENDIFRWLMQLEEQGQVRRVGLSDPVIPGGDRHTLFEIVRQV